MILKSASSQLKITFRSPSGHLGVILKSACGQFAVPSRVTWSQLEVTSWPARDEVSRVSLKAHLEVIQRSCWGQVGGELGATLTSARCHLEIHLEASLRSPLGEAALRPATLKSFHGHLELGYLGLTLRSAWNEAEVAWNEAEVRARPLWGEVSSRSASGQVEVTLWSAQGPLEVRLLTRSHLGGQRDVSSKSLSVPLKLFRSQLEVSLMLNWSQHGSDSGHLEVTLKSLLWSAWHHLEITLGSAWRQLHELNLKPPWGHLEVTEAKSPWGRLVVSLKLTWGQLKLGLRCSQLEVMRGSAWSHLAASSLFWVHLEARPPWAQLEAALRSP